MEYGQPSTRIIKCGNEFRGHLKRDGKDSTGLPVNKVRKCESEFQDETYGKDMRVVNHAPGKDGLNKNRYICSVCLRPHEVK